jgi:hypothetical protein
MMTTERPIVRGLELWDQRSHVERIDDLERKPAMKPETIENEQVHPDHPKGELRPYRTMSKSFINDAMRPGGSLVMLYRSEVGPHHRYAADVVQMQKDAWERGADYRPPVIPRRH